MLSSILIKQLTRLILLACITWIQSGYALSKVTYQLDWIPGADKAAIYVGIEKGFFKDEGLEIEIAPGKGSTDALTKLSTNRSDIGSAGISALMTAVAKHDIPVKAIFPIFKKAPHAFMTIEGSGIESTSDLKNTRVATSPFTSSNVFLPLVLRENGLTEKDFKLLKVDASALGPMLASGRVNTIIAWMTDKQRYITQLKKINKELKVIPWSTQGMDLYGIALVASKKFLDTQPETAEKFSRAFYKAMQFVNDKPLESAEIINKQIPQIEIEDALATINEFNLLTQVAHDSMTYPKFDEQKLKTTWASVSEAQSLEESDLNPLSLVNGYEHR